MAVLSSQGWTNWCISKSCVKTFQPKQRAKTQRAGEKVGFRGNRESEDLHLRKRPESTDKPFKFQ